jgi:hypothetical protein
MLAALRELGDLKHLQPNSGRTRLSAEALHPSPELRS